MCTPTALLRTQFGMEGQESTSSTQEAEKTKLAYIPQTTKLKHKHRSPENSSSHIEVSTHASHSVVLTDALSILQALRSNRNTTNHNNLSAALASLCKSHAVILQWIPSHCNMPGNEAADSLAKEGTTKEQVDRSTSYVEVKTILKVKQHSKWMLNHPQYNKTDPYYLLTRREQVTVFRLRKGHNRLNHHLYSKLQISHTEQCPCGTGSQTTEHLLQSCPIYKLLRKGIWQDHTPIACKLYGSLGDLWGTATFIGETGVSIGLTRRRSIRYSYGQTLLEHSLNLYKLKQIMVKWTMGYFDTSGTEKQKPKLSMFLVQVLWTQPSYLCNIQLPIHYHGEVGHKCVLRHLHLKGDFLAFTLRQIHHLTLDGDCGKARVQHGTQVELTNVHLALSLLLNISPVSQVFFMTPVKMLTLENQQMCSWWTHLDPIEGWQEQAQYKQCSHNTDLLAKNFHDEKS